MKIIAYLCTCKPDNDERYGNRLSSILARHSRDEALGLVRRYKQVIAPRFDVEPKVMMFGSYSKGYANPDRQHQLKTTT